MVSLSRECVGRKYQATLSPPICSYGIEKLFKLLPSYTPDDIYNAEETGTFLRPLSDKTLDFKDFDFNGGKKNKARVTAKVCANMS